MNRSPGCLAGWKSFIAYSCSIHFPPNKLYSVSTLINFMLPVIYVMPFITFDCVRFVRERLILWTVNLFIAVNPRSFTHTHTSIGIFDCSLYIYLFVDWIYRIQYDSLLFMNIYSQFVIKFAFPKGKYVGFVWDCQNRLGSLTSGFCTIPKIFLFFFFRNTKKKQNLSLSYD